jgi:hypothetical protein
MYEQIRKYVSNGRFIYVRVKQLTAEEHKEYSQTQSTVWINVGTSEMQKSNLNT